MYVLNDCATSLIHSQQEESISDDDVVDASPPAADRSDEPDSRFITVSHLVSCTQCLQRYHVLCTVHIHVRKTE